MGLLDSIVRRFGYQPVDYYALQQAARKTQEIANPPAFLQASAAEERFNMPDRTTPEAQLELYRKLTWVQIAVAAKAGVVTTTAFNVMAMAGEETRQIPNHPFEMLLRRPNPLQSRAEFIEATMSYYDLTGNAFWWLSKRNPQSPPDELWCIPTQRMTPVPDGRMYLRGYIYETDWGDKFPLELHEVVHFKRFHPLNQFVGLSPLEALSTVAIGDIAMQQWNTNFFAKDNAKIPGILAFSDPIQDSEWDRMKSDIRSRYGGTNRELMMLRNAGKGGVQYIATAMSQGDMQFLDGRTFTKEEIFAIYAPGLSSMLAVNATEANSVSGKRTFVEYAVWPHLVRIAEKITSDILPLYGGGLVGEFTDIRVTDKQLELAEIAAFGQTHTVDEVRAKYYQSDPLGDDRGNLLVAEVGKGLTPADPDAATQPPTLTQEPPPAAQNGDGDTGSKDGEDGEDSEDQTQERQGEIKALKRWLRNRKNPDPLKFKRVHLSEDDVLQVAGWEAATAHDFFTRGATRDNWTALKALVLQLDPDEDDAEERIYRELERRGETALLRAFREQWRNLLPPNAEDMELDELMEYVNARLLQTPVIPDAVSRIVQNGADAGVNVALDQLGRIGVSFDYTLVNTRAREWAAQYGGELVRNIDDTTQQAVRQSVQRWYTNGEPLSALTADLEPTFGEKRARLIASTETTRASAQGTYTGLKESGVVTGVIFKTSNDEKVCPWCGSLDGKIISIDGGAFYDELSPELQSRLKRRFDLPPVHPGCILPGNEIVLAGGLNAAAESFYNGRCVEMVFADGRKITVTKNHPILTPSGWIQAQFIGKGDYVIGTRQAERIAASVKPDYNHAPTAIEKVFSALKKSGGVSSVRVPAAPENLHGDGRDIHGDIHIVFADGFMGCDGQSAISKYIGEDGFDYRSVGDVALSGKSLPCSQLETLRLAANGGVCIGGHGDPLLVRRFTPTGDHSLATTTRRDAMLEQALTEGRATHTDLSSEFLLRFASEITLDEVIEYRLFNFSGHVYDLQSDDYELYICNGVIVKNCRCRISAQVEPT